jgi:hypothetical protein
MKANMNTRNAILDVDKERIARKSYLEINDEKIKAQSKKYREEHSDEIKKRCSEIVQCECGCFIKRHTKDGSAHSRSQRHKNGMKIFAPKIV